MTRRGFRCADCDLILAPGRRGRSCPDCDGDLVVSQIATCPHCGLEYAATDAEEHQATLCWFRDQQAG